MTRIHGILNSWNDDRGFGFITPAGGGKRVFVHISAFTRDALRPEIGDILSFEPKKAADGRVQAVAVHGPRGTPRSRPYPALVGYLVIAAFVAVAFSLSTLWPISRWFVAIFVIMSVACFVAYAADKSAARAGRWRVPEVTLLLLGILGGWPGAVLAQQWLRHKTRKPSFLGPFWVTVVINTIAFALLSPLPLGDLVAGLLSR
ncbi:cold shock and DUF1294 domain-containing protein [Salinibacterium sp.]|uniref:cold shock and DUF1294 domain-containing protein n=1 Tax=Salinibacterium sp. TaxID=1915057 RepID=UPI00286CF368|nr:cold shock and DUF1294 domain-containing protein [Salinibacterium sp.]